MTLFARWISIDWSAASRPARGRDSIWIADARSDGPRAGGAPALDNPRTRSEAGTLLVDRLSKGAGPTLLGIDASLSLPGSGVTRLLGEESTWDDLVARIHGAVTDDDSNANNRFEAAASLNRDLGGPDGPFWGHPPTQNHDGLAATRPTFPWDGAVEEYRVCEARMRARGFAVQSTWKIAYQASVGGQFLTVLGWLDRLRRQLPGLRVFPFDTGFGAEPAPGEVWVAEVWPGEFALDGAHEVRDADQVSTVARRLRQADRDDTLATLLSPPQGVDPTVALAEGWPISFAAAG